MTPAVHRRLADLAWVLLLAGTVASIVLGAQALSGQAMSLSLPAGVSLDVTVLTADRLTGLFLVICFGVAAPAFLAGIGGRGRSRLPGALAVLAFSTALILLSGNVFALVFGWELLTFAFYLLSGYDRGKTVITLAAVRAVSFGKASGAGVELGFLLLAAKAHTLSIGDLGLISHGAVWQAGYALLLIGFAVKVGLVPVQIWLPPTYIAAPPAARALMAGVAVNVGFYGWWRTLDVLGAPPVWLIVVLFAAAGITAILGITHASVSRRLPEVVAWSSVENAGVIGAGFAVGMTGAAIDNAAVMAAGLVAGLAQIVAHALGKTLLFTSIGVIEEGAGTPDLSRLRGIGRRLPWAGTGLCIGSITLAGLPLTAGFASEWLTLQALMQQFRLDQVGLQLATVFAAALVALTIGVAGLTFVRLVALTCFGPPEPITVDRDADRRPAVRAAIGLLCLACGAVAALAPLELRMIASGITNLVGHLGYRAVPSPWVLAPIYSGFSALSPTWLWLVIPGLSGAILLVALAFSGRRLWRVRRAPAWTSGSPGVDRGLGYSSFGFANPMRTVLANLLMTTSVRSHTPPGAVAEDPAVTTTYEVDVVEVVEQYLYRPLKRPLIGVVRIAKRLQSGRLDAYLAYMLIAVVAVLALVTASS